MQIVIWFLFISFPFTLFSAVEEAAPLTQSKTENSPSEQSEQRAEQPQNPEKNEALENPNSPHTFSATVTSTSDYRDRGISQTMREPAIQGEFDYKHQSGFYLKTWASNVDGTGNFLTNTSMEWDFYIGLRQKIFKTEIAYDMGLEFYYYPGGQPKVHKQGTYNFIEYYVGITWKNFELKITQTLTDYSGINSDNPPINWNKRRPIRPNGHSYNSPYLEGNYLWKFYPKWTAAFHLGFQGITNYPEMNFFDWNITVTRAFDWFNVSLAYVASSAKHAFYDVPDDAFNSHRKQLGAPGAVLSVSRSF